MSATSRSLSLVLALGVAACASGAPATESAPSPAPATTVAQPAQTPDAAPPAAAEGGGYFSSAQADRGRDTFRSLCTECHYSSEFSDAQFKFKWSRRTAENLYDLIFTQMPESAPGSLSPEEAVGLVSYVLRLNGLESGTSELAADPEELAGISLRSIRN